MAKIIAHVFETMDYDAFFQLPCNRDVTQKRKEKLVASFSCKRILTPIVVNEKMQIIDGQGRYEACKELGLPIWYVIQEGADINDCRRLNQYNIKWESIDFVKSYAEAGNDNYIRLLNTSKELGRPITWVVSAGYRTTHNEKNNFITEGTLQFTDKDAENAKEVSDKGDEILNALLYSHRTNTAFWGAVKVVIRTNGYDHSKMIRNCKVNRASYAQMSNLETQLIEFERIYNFKAKQNKLYFSDYMKTRGYNVRTYKTGADNALNSYDAENVSTLKGIENE